MRSEGSGWQFLDAFGDNADGFLDLLLRNDKRRGETDDILMRGLGLYDGTMDGWMDGWISDGQKRAQRWAATGIYSYQQSLFLHDKT